MSYKKETIEFSITNIRECLVEANNNKWTEFLRSWELIIHSNKTSDEYKYEKCINETRQMLFFYYSCCKNILLLNNTNSESCKLQRQEFENQNKFVELLLSVLSEKEIFYKYLDQISNFDKQFKILAQEYNYMIEQLTAIGDYEEMYYLTLEFANNVRLAGLIDKVSESKIQLKFQTNHNYQIQKIKIELDNTFRLE